MRSLVFVINPASGGRRGTWLMARLRERFAADRVLPIHDIDLVALARSLDPSTCALVACGGDGTAASVLDAAWQADPDLPLPVGVLPLGTGNDLARSLGWHGTEISPSSIDHDLHALQVAEARVLDRWHLAGPGFTSTFYNYVSLGADARIAKRFHALRLAHGAFFRSAKINRAWYGLVALGEPGPEITPALTGLELPDWSRAVVFANIPSYAGGTRLSPEITADDGWLDAFALGPGAVMALAAAGRRQPHSLGRRKSWTWQLHQPTVLQLDGEPLRAAPGLWNIDHRGRAKALAWTTGPGPSRR